MTTYLPLVARQLLPSMDNVNTFSLSLMQSTSNYAARRFGVRAAMPGFIAKKLCPKLVIVKTNFAKYRAVSKEVQEIVAQYDPGFSPMGLDESYLDLTDYVREKYEERASSQSEGASHDGGQSAQEPGTRVLCA